MILPLAILLYFSLPMLVLLIISGVAYLFTERDWLLVVAILSLILNIVATATALAQLW